MAGWERVWSDEQKDAIIAAYFVAGIHNMAQITRLAHAGELRFEGKTLPPYRNPSGLLIPSASVRDIIRTEEKRRKGKRHSDLVNKPAPEAHELLRRRLTSMLDHETLRIEHWQKMNPYKELDAEHVRRLGRALRELQSLPQAGERARQPGTAIPGQGKVAGESTDRDSVGGSILSALSSPGIEPAQKDPNPIPRDNGEQSGDERINGQATGENGGGNGAADAADGVGEEGPGSWARAQVSALTAGAADRPST